MNMKSSLPNFRIPTGFRIDPRTTVRIALTLAWRAFQVLVVIPASLVATIYLVGELVGEKPVQSTLDGLYAYAEEAIRPAPTGHVLIRKCIEQPPYAGAPPSIEPVPCETVTHTVQIGDAIVAHIRALTTLYLVLVAVSFGMLVATASHAIGPRSGAAGRHCSPIPQTEKE